MNDERRKRIARALDYPYEASNESFLFENGKPSEDPDRIDEIINAPDRKRILAIGSNRSPKQLACKFKQPDEPAIAAVAATLHDFDAVYAVRIASYGAILATLACQPGAIVHVAVLYLTKGRLQRMYESEGARSACSNRNRNTEKLPIDSEAQRRLAVIFVVRAVWAGDPPFQNHAGILSWRTPTRRLAQLSFRPLAIPDHMVAVALPVRPRPLAGNAA